MARRFRFSVRTLAIIVTLMCVFIAGWEGAKKDASVSINKMWRLSETETNYISQAHAPLPFVIVRNEWEENFADPEVKVLTVYRRCYVWLFGPKMKLPFESQLSRTLDGPTAWQADQQ